MTTNTRPKIEPSGLLKEYFLSAIQWNDFSASGNRSISYIRVLRKVATGGSRLTFTDDPNRLYAYRWDCDDRWTVIDPVRRLGMAYFDTEEEARADLLAGLNHRRLPVVDAS